MQHPNLTRLCICSQISLLSTGCGICKPGNEPCIPWIEMGETYEVEIVQHFVLPPEAHSTSEPIYPYGRQRGPEQTCGQGFDIEPGDIVKMTAAEKQDDSNVDECPRCIHIRASASVSGISKVSSIEGAFSYSLGQPVFAEMLTAAIDDKCRGRYWIGIIPVSSYFIEHTEQYVATDHMLFREFFEENTEACRRPGSEISSKTIGCWDSWTVRIRDSAGKLLTKDQPPRPVESDAATSDAESTNQDME